MELTHIKRMLALANHLGLKEVDDEIEFTSPREDEPEFKAEGCEYLVLTDEEADEKAIEYIRESVWAFRPEFLIHYLPTGMTVEAISAICEKCEVGNASLLALVEAGSGFEKFAEDSISSDGRAHFMNTYDDKEEEAELDGVTYYIYRMN